jgi:hypothetical protein|tara:strand:- start:3430 stop:3963 length:534 start_codon:yes stop_codon:yes gene_type:complete
MSNYRIIRWDPIIAGDNPNIIVPLIYIKPDKNFLELIRDNNSVINCEISGTNMIYDGKKIPGLVSKSSNTPNYRPNFFDATDLYVITLISNWYGYPDVNLLGSVNFSNNPKSFDDKIIKENNTKKDDVKENDLSINSLKTELSNDLNNPIFTASIISIVLIFVILIIAFFLKRKKLK